MVERLGMVDDCVKGGPRALDASRMSMEVEDAHESEVRISAFTTHQQNEKVAVGFCDAVAIDRHRHIPPPLCGPVGEFWFAVIVLWG